MTTPFASRAATLSLLFALEAVAQYRPPPMTEAERLVAEGDEKRVEANKALLTGDKRLAAERYKQAIELYKKALAANADSIPAAIGLGDAANALGDTKLVVDVLGPFDKAHPGQVDISYYLGLALFKQNRPAEALPHLELVSKANRPDHLLVHYYLGRHYLYEGRAKESVIELGQYLAQRPARLAANDHEIHLMLGHAYLALREAANARASFENAQKGRPEWLPAQLGLASAFELEGKSAEAVKLLEGLVQRFPQNGEPRERLAWVLLSRNELKRAESVAVELVRMQPQSGTAHHVLGEIRLASKDARQAESDLKKAIELAPRLNEAKLALARAVQAQNRHDEAIALLEQAAAGGLNTPALWATLGSVYRRAGRYGKAVEAHQKVVKLLPDQPLGKILIGADHFATGEWDRAIDAYDGALQLDPKNPTARKWLAQALMHRARNATRADQLDDAARDLRRAADLEPTAKVTRALGAVLLAQQKYADAQQVLKRACAMADASWKDNLLLGYAHLGAHAASEAVGAFEKAASLSNDPAVHADIYAGWALAKLELGEFDTAVAKLSEPSTSKSAALVRDANLPLALVRRALDRVAEGDADGAVKDLEWVDKLTKGRSDDIKRLAELAELLVDVEKGRFGPAQAAIARIFGKKPPGWQRKNSASLLSAYLDYRRGDIRKAERSFTRALQQASEDQRTWLTHLDRAMDRRDGELAYLKGSMAAAERALQKAAAADPLNPWVQHNLACVQHRKGKAKEAIAAWEKVKASIPEAHLNLGIDAHTRTRDYEAAVAHYGRYIAAGGEKASLVREWRQRLMDIYGIEAPLPDAGKPDGERARPEVAGVNESPPGGGNGEGAVKPAAPEVKP